MIPKDATGSALELASRVLAIEADAVRALIARLDERFLAAELVREKLFRLLGDELPYGCSVIIDKFEEEGNLRRIYASIVVEKDGHKAMIIGAQGEKLKSITSAARLDMEKLFGGKVYLEVWVKVRRGWTDDDAALRRLGYD